MLKERYEIEVKMTKKMIVEVDPSKFNDREVAKLLKQTPDIKTVEGHLSKIAAMHTRGKTAGPFGVYGLVCVNGDPGGRALPEMYPMSGINIVPISDNYEQPLVEVEKINPTRRPKAVG